MLSLLLAFSSTVLAEPVVVVSAQSPVGAITVDQASEIFLGQLTTWPNGNRVVPFDQAEGSPTRRDFHARVTRKSGPLLKAYWSKVLFTGRGQPPREATDDGAVKKLLAQNVNAIGYIDSKAVDATVKVVLVVGEK